MPDLAAHTIIVGAGLAGASAALALSEREDVLILEAVEPAAGASGVAGGLFSPMIALRGRPVWRIDEAIEAFRAQLDAAAATHLFDDRGVLRPAKDEQQVEFFEQSVARCPEHAVWLPKEVAKERFPRVAAPMGAMLATTGGAISLVEYTRKLVEASERRGARLQAQARVIEWGEVDGVVYVDYVTDVGSDEPIRLYAERVILAGGNMFFSHPTLQHLDLHAVKGQTVRIEYPEGLSAPSFPPVSGLAYVIPEPDSIAIGSSFQHQFDHERIEPAISDDLCQKAASVVPELECSKVTEAHVGIRVTVPKIRLPMVGPLSEKGRVWVFTAFGSKGLLLAPLLAGELPRYLVEPKRIPGELRVREK